MSIGFILRMALPSACLLSPINFTNLDKFMGSEEQELSE